MGEGYGALEKTGVVLCDGNAWVLVEGSRLGGDPPD